MFAGAFSERDPPAGGWTASSGSVHVSTVLDADHDHFERLLVDPVEDSVGPTTRGPQPGQFLAQGFAGSPGLFDERSREKCDRWHCSPAGPRQGWARAKRRSSLLETSSDPTVVELQRPGHRHRREAFSAFVSRLGDEGALRQGVTRDDAVDRAWILSGVAPSPAATEDCNWIDERYASWLGNLLCEQLLDPSAGTANRGAATAAGAVRGNRPLPRWLRP